MKLFGVCSGFKNTDFNLSKLNAEKLNEIINGIHFSSFIGFIEVKDNTDLIKLKSDLYLDEVVSINTDFGVKNNVILKLIPLDQVRESFDDYRYKNQRDWLNNGNNYFLKNNENFVLYVNCLQQKINATNWKKSLIKKELRETFKRIEESYKISYKEVQLDMAKVNLQFISKIKTGDMVVFGHKTVLKFVEVLNENDFLFLEWNSNTEKFDKEKVLNERSSVFLIGSAFKLSK